MRILVIYLLAIALGGMTAIAFYNAKPVCDDLYRSPSGHLVCVYDLGNIQEDEANVRIRK